MDTDGKRRTILELVKLGMDFETAAFTAECSQAEMTQLSADETFQAHIKVCSALLERDLLKKLNDVMTNNAAEGGSVELRWMLERLNAKRWGSSNKLALTDGHGEDLFKAFENTSTRDLANAAGFAESDL